MIDSMRKFIRLSNEGRSADAHRIGLIDRERKESRSFVLLPFCIPFGRFNSERMSPRNSPWYQSTIWNRSMKLRSMFYFSLCETLNDDQWSKNRDSSVRHRQRTVCPMNWSRRNNFIDSFFSFLFFSLDEEKRKEKRKARRGRIRATLMTKYSCY